MQDHTLNDGFGASILAIVSHGCLSIVEDDVIVWVGLEDTIVCLGEQLGEGEG